MITKKLSKKKLVMLMLIFFSLVLAGIAISVLISMYNNNYLSVNNSGVLTSYTTTFEGGSTYDDSATLDVSEGEPIIYGGEDLGLNIKNLKDYSLSLSKKEDYCYESTDENIITLYPISNILPDPQKKLWIKISNKKFTGEDIFFKNINTVAKGPVNYNGFQDPLVLSTGCRVSQPHIKVTELDLRFSTFENQTSFLYISLGFITDKIEDVLIVYYFNAYDNLNLVEFQLTDFSDKETIPKEYSSECLKIREGQNTKSIDPFCVAEKLRNDKQTLSKLSEKFTSHFEDIGFRR